MKYLILIYDFDLVFIGGIGAIRYCSSRDLGNYCNDVKNKGDELEYRSCIFTCDTDGCNKSSFTKISLGLLLTVCFLKFLI